MKKILSLLLFLCFTTSVLAIDYPIVYIKAPRKGDTIRSEMTDANFYYRTEPNADLILRHPDGTEEILVDATGTEAIIDPCPDFNAEWVYYAKLYNSTYKPYEPPTTGSDLFKINVKTKEIIQLTFGEKTPLASFKPFHKSYNTGPCVLPSGKIMFTSSRNMILTAQNQVMQLYIMDNNGKNVEQIGYLNLAGAMHPVVLMDGRVIWSSLENQGVRGPGSFDGGGKWAIWTIWPDGRQWSSLIPMFTHARTLHWQAQSTNGIVSAVDYYANNNNGFGTMIGVSPSVPDGVPPNGSPNPLLNPPIQEGWHQDFKPAYNWRAFSPYGLFSLTPFAISNDRPSPKDIEGRHVGKVCQQSGAPNNDLLIVWSNYSPATLNLDPKTPYFDAGIYLLKNSLTVDHPSKFELVVNDPLFNEQQPKALVKYSDIYGIEQPHEFSWLPNNGTKHSMLPKGTPFGIVGTSTFYKRDSKPGRGAQSYDGWDSFNSNNTAFPGEINWNEQGADAGKYFSDDIFAVRIVAMEKRPDIGLNAAANDMFNHAADKEILRILGEIPLRKNPGELDPDGNPDTSFAVKIPADVPFTFQSIDNEGRLLNMAQTWHQIRPGEVRLDCGGCHAHSQVGTPFFRAAQRIISDNIDATQILTLGTKTPLLKLADNSIDLEFIDKGSVTLEYRKDIEPIFDTKCISCHKPDANGIVAGNLDLSNRTTITSLPNKIKQFYETWDNLNTYYRLTNDTGGKFGYKPVNKEIRWTRNNVSRYVRQYQSRRSLLTWKVWGDRLDGWTNEQHPTESVLGDFNTLPTGANRDLADIDYLDNGCKAHEVTTLDEKLAIARWIDTGCNYSIHPEGSNKGLWVDCTKPTLALSSPRIKNEGPVQEIRIGLFDYFSGLDLSNFSVKANIDIDNIPAGTELKPLFIEVPNEFIWVMPLANPITTDGELTVTIKDKAGNEQKVVRTFSVTTPLPPPPVNHPPTIEGLVAEPTKVNKGEFVNISLNNLEDEDGNIERTYFYLDINKSGSIDLDDTLLEDGIILISFDIDTNKLPVGIHHILAIARDKTSLDSNVVGASFEIIEDELAVLKAKITALEAALAECKLNEANNAAKIKALEDKIQAAKAALQ